jgi:hypothetical protein
MTIVDGRTIGKRLHWDCGDVGTRARKAPPRAFCWHWTGGTRDAKGVCETLRARSLSVHYIIDPDGRTVLCVDPVTTVAYHAGDANAWTIGCEIVGGPARDFTPEQYAAIGELADAQTLPRRIFRAGDDVRTFSGHLEHRDLTTRKIDAGGRVMRFLAARWALPPY